MEAYKILIKNVALFLFVGALPFLCWVSGLFSAFSLPSLFILTACVFFILWIKSRNLTYTYRNLLLSRGDTWGICEGDQIVDCSPSFPAKSLEELRVFFHHDDLVSIDEAIEKLTHEKIPFQMKARSAIHEAIYAIEGTAYDDKFIFWFKNITDAEHKRRLQFESMRKSEDLINNLQSTLDSLPVLIWQRDEHLKITYCNLAYSNAVQSSQQKIYDECIELIQPRFAKLLARKALHTEGAQSFESPAIADGDRRHFRIWEIPNHRDPGKTLGIAYDITELKDIRSEMKRLIHSHDEVLAHLSTAISVFDSEGTLQYYNQAYVELHSFEEAFLKTYPRLDEVLEDLRSRRQLPEYADFPAYKRRRLHQLKEQVDPREDLMHLPDERTLRIFSAPHPMGGLLFMFEDVTDYLALERRNKTLLDAYQATLDNLFEGVVVIGSDNRLKIFNPSFLRLWNFEEDDVKADQHLTLIMEKLKNDIAHEGEWETYKAQLIEKITDRVPKSDKLKRTDGNIVNYRYVPLPSGDHLLSYTDATDTFRVQNALQEKNEALETADRLKSEFLANISYELRAPLNTIIGFTEILSHQYFGDLNERQTDYVNGVLDSSNSLLHLVNDILDLASIEAGYLTLHTTLEHIPSLLKEVLTHVSNRAEESRQYLTLNCAPEVDEWAVDTKRLKQALYNLLSNAVKFTPQDGMITLEAQVNNGTLEISVTDTGVGMSQEEQARLIDTFKLGRSHVQSGTGLGLALVKKLIELHGGQIDITSEPSQGTKVTCVLPKLMANARITGTKEVSEAS